MSIFTTAIDHAELQRQLRGPGAHTFDAHWTGDRAGTVVYLSDGARLNLAADGLLQFISRAGAVEVLQQPVSSTEEAFRLIRSYGKQHEVKAQAQRLLRVLEEDVPASVAHWAVEGAKNALGSLIKQAHTVDYFHGS